MAVRTAEAEWKGTLTGGSGTLKSETDALRGSYSFASRFEEGSGTNPEELLGAAHAGCFAMAFANVLDEGGHEPERVSATARVHLDGDEGITRIELACEAEVPGIDESTFQERAKVAKENCPVSKALGAVPISLDARLVG